MKRTKQIIYVAIKTLCMSSMAIISLSASASFKRFEAPMDESQWQFSGNPLGCYLNHDIPLYGRAEFSKSAGKKEVLSFNLGYQRHQVATNTFANVRGIAPSWQPNSNSRELGKIKLTSGKHIVKSRDKASWKLLNELEVGRFPTFMYQDFEQLEDQVSVALNSVGFRAEYDKFLDCLASLVRYKLPELTKMTLFFDFDKAGIKDNYRERLEALSQYIKYDPSVQVVFISGYTDSKGPRYYNHKLSERRINSVKKLLQLDGVEDSRFKTQPHGEKNPVATNRTSKGRAKNRRVIIRIAQIN
ncbi:MAG: OmpA family protein [Kangiellaceae bacterium]|nr:OmpA family protein [Kangiellaceae bacterium]MCW8997959.1 OmpA family protein [Kangiellaceae bacterium]